MNQSQELTPELITRACEGEKDAFRAFYTHYNPTVRWAVGLRVYRWPELVPLFDDIVQEVWLRLMQRDGKVLRYFRSERGVPFSRYLAIISARLGWRLAKRHLRGSEEQDDVPSEQQASFISRLIDIDILNRLHALVQQHFCEKDYLLFVKHYVQGESIKQIGRVLGLSENAAHQRHHRMKRKLRRFASDLLADPPRNGTVEIVTTALILLATMSDVKYWQYPDSTEARGCFRS